jgi:hypothetical protein
VRNLLKLPVQHKMYRHLIHVLAKGVIRLPEDAVCRPCTEVFLYGYRAPDLRGEIRSSFVTLHEVSWHVHLTERLKYFFI